MGFRVNLLALIAVALAGCAAEEAPQAASEAPAPPNADGKAARSDITVNPNGVMTMPPKK